jgi:ATP-dependent Clp protease ATP-binding subunit ClpA
MRLSWRRRRSNAGFRPVEPYLFAGAEEARRLGHDTIGTEHVLLGMLRNDDGDACRLLRRLDVSPLVLEETLGLEPAAGGRIDAAALANIGIDYDAIRERLEESFGAGALEDARASCLGIQPRLKMALAVAEGYAEGRPAQDADVLLGILSVPDSYAACALSRLGVTPEAVTAARAAD